MEGYFSEAKNTQVTELHIHMKCKFYTNRVITHYNTSPTFLFDKYEQSTRNLGSEPLHNMNWGFDQLQRKLHYHRQAQTTRTYTSKRQSHNPNNYADNGKEKRQESKRQAKQEAQPSGDSDFNRIQLLNSQS